MSGKNWRDLLDSAPVAAYAGRLVRCIPQLTFAGGSPPSYLFTSGQVNRCNPAGVSCLYMAEDRDTADREYHSYYAAPEPQLILPGKRGHENRKLVSVQSLEE